MVKCQQKYVKTFSIPLMVKTPLEHSFDVRVFEVMFTRAKCPSTWIPHLLIEKKIFEFEALAPGFAFFNLESSRTLVHRTFANWVKNILCFEAREIFQHSKIREGFDLERSTKS